MAEYMTDVRYFRRSPTDADRTAINEALAPFREWLWSGISAPNAEGAPYKAWLVCDDFHGWNDAFSERCARVGEIFDDILRYRNLINREDCED